MTNYISKTPKELKKMKVPEKPKIRLNLRDRLRQIQMWLSDSIAGVVGQAIQYLIPKWVWWAFVGLLFALLAILMVLK